MSSAGGFHRLVAGAIAGGVATWVMDLVTTGYLASQNEEDAEREKDAQPDGKSSVDHLLERMESTFGIQVDHDLRPTALNVLHYGLGVGPAMFYALLRDRVPFVGSARGLAFGLLVFFVNDEYMNTALGLAGPPEAYPFSTHVRGFVGHLALGATTDTVLDVLGA